MPKKGSDGRDATAQQKYECPAKVQGAPLLIAIAIDQNASVNAE
jgi:hypothetical protein